jgi:HAMP domain-containing protein
MRVSGFFTANIRRKILSSFIVVIILVLALAVATYIQLEMVRSLSRQVTPSSLRLTALQGYALAMSDFEGNLDRYFVIGGPQFQEAMRQDIERMNDALKAADVDLTPEMETVYNTLLSTAQQLETETIALLEQDPSELSSREVNERIVSVFAQVETARNLEQELAELTSAQLQSSALEQETLISRVVIQALAFGGIVALLVMIASVFVTRSIARPLAEVTEAAQQIEQGNLDIEVPVTTQDEVGQLARTFNNMAAQLRNILGTLEQQVKERTRGLAIVGRINEHLTGILDVDQLLDEVVNQIKEGFDYYHVHIYLFNQAKNQLVVTAGTGQAGAMMKANGHTIDVNTKSLVARAARGAEVVIIANVRQ